MHTFPPFLTTGLVPGQLTFEFMQSAQVPCKSMYLVNVVVPVVPTVVYSTYPEWHMAPLQPQFPVSTATKMDMCVAVSQIDTPQSCATFSEMEEYAASEELGPISSFLNEFNCSNCRFHACSTETPLDFLTNVVQQTDMQEGALVTSMIYVAKFFRLSSERGSGYPKPCGRCLFATCALLATKYLCDECVGVNATWAKLAGLSVSQMCAYERELLQAFDYNLSVEHADYAFFEYAIRHDLFSDFLHVQRTNVETCEVAAMRHAHASTAPTTSGVATSPSSCGGTSDVDPAIFATTEYQNILQDLYSMS